MRLPLLHSKPLESGGETDLECLHQVPILQDLSPVQLEIVHALADRQQFREGSTIIAEGEAGDCMFFLLRGTVEITRTLVLQTGRGEIGKKDKVLSRMSAEQHPYFGEMALLGTDVRSATVTAASDCITLRLTKEDLLILERDHPAIAYAIVRRIAEELCARVHRLNQEQLKLTTALSIALSR